MQRENLTFRRIKINRYSFIYKMAAILAFPVALAISWYLLEKQPGKQVDKNYCMFPLRQVKFPNVFYRMKQSLVNTGSSNLRNDV